MGVEAIPLSFLSFGVRWYFMYYMCLFHDAIFDGLIWSRTIDLNDPCFLSHNSLADYMIGKIMLYRLRWF